MLKKIFLSVISILIISSTSYSQKESERSVYLSIHSGLFFTALDNFDETYNSNSGIVIGFGAGLPVSSSSYIYVKATLFSKSGIPITKNYTFQDGSLVLTSQTREGNAEFMQWIINGGLLINFYLSKDYTIAVNGGLTYSIINIEENNSSGTINSSLNANGISGFFLGALLEKNFANSPFTVFIEPQYNFSRNDILTFFGNYGGLNLNMGIKYYFNDGSLK